MMLKVPICRKQSMIKKMGTVGVGSRMHPIDRPLRPTVAALMLTAFDGVRDLSIILQLRSTRPGHHNIRKVFMARSVDSDPMPMAIE